MPQTIDKQIGIYSVIEPAGHFFAVRFNIRDVTL